MIKLSGQALADEPVCISPVAVHNMAMQVKEVKELGVDVVIVIGGGNIFRGEQGSQQGIDRTTGDYMGMLATIINSLACKMSLKNSAYQPRVQSAIATIQVAEPFIRRRGLLDILRKDALSFLLAEPEIHIFLPIQRLLCASKWVPK